MKRLVRHVLAVAMACILLATVVPATERRAEPWPERTLELARSLPMQEGGRIKPLSTVARFTLMRIAGRTSLTTSTGERLDATAWLLDVLLFPEAAAEEPLFLVSDAQAVEAIGIARGEKRKRDRWTYEELQPGLPRLFGLAHDYSAIDQKVRTGVQAEVVRLAENVLAFLRFARALDFARHDLMRAAGPALAAQLRGEQLGFDDIVERYGEIARLANDADERVARDASLLLEAATMSAADARAVAWFAPACASEAAWVSAADLLTAAQLRDPPPAAQIDALRGLVTATEGRADPTSVERGFEVLHAALATLDLERRELGRIPLEVAYYRLGLLRFALVAFLVAFAAAALALLWPRGRASFAVPFGLASIGTALVVVAIVVRCVLRGRPPVSTLYETVLFVTACGSALALAIEWVARRRMLTAVAALFGALGLFLADGYEALDAQDTMPSLVAVLDTNFWLATHVTSITLGYAAGMLAAVLGSAYVLLALVRRERFERASRSHLARTTCGVVCFALVFSLTGTILGGIWANESWGRFWGWDPKENGALLIVLSQIALLHARRAGLLRELGTCVAAAFGGSVVTFSWWGVNLLGVGLHSYGFTSGVQRALWTYYALQWSVVALGGAIAWRERRARVAVRRITRASTDDESRAAA